MSTATMEAPERRKLSSVAPWGIEADHPRNCDLLLQSLSGLKLRSAIKATKMVFTREAGEQVQVPASAGMVDGLPAGIPGMQLHVDPSKGAWKMVDPLRDNPELCEKIKRAIDHHTSMRTATTLKGVPPQSGKLNPDQMKTLVREMRFLVEAGEAKVVQGIAPSQEDMDSLPGNYLTNPLNLSDWHQPKHECDMEAWTQTLNKLG